MKSYNCNNFRDRLSVDLNKESITFFDSILTPLRILVRKLRLFREFFYDFNRFCRYSSVVHRGNEREKLQALLVMAYHSLEKGLSLPSPRPGFGIKHINTLISRLNLYVNKYGFDCYVMASLNALEAYNNFNINNGINNDYIDEYIRNLKSRLEINYEYELCSGTKTINKKEFIESSNVNFRKFFEARSSVRQYSEESVSSDYIKDAVKIALKTPCVCNRQSWKVRVFKEKENVKKILSIQEGAVGFAEKIGTLLIVSSDLSYFQSSGERNQCWVDGGLFSMSLLLALHSFGLVTCSLNWSKNSYIDNLLKETMDIPQSESIIMLISVGHPLHTFKVASSWRKPVEDIIFFDNDIS